MTGEADLAALKARLRAWLQRHGLSARRLAARTGLSESTVYRLLTLPSYRGTPETWRRLAQVCGWDPQGTLAQAGFSDAVPPQADAWGLVARGLTQLGVSPSRQDAIRQLLELDAPRDPPPELAHPNNARS